MSIFAKFCLFFKRLKKKEFGVKAVPIDDPNHPLQYGGKEYGRPVYSAQNSYKLIIINYLKI